jgi:hypothetical protein
MTFLTVLTDHGIGDVLYSPYIIPVAGCLTGLGIVLGGIWSGIRNREIQSQERLAAIAAGVPIPLTAEELAITHGAASKPARRSDGRGARRAGIVLISTAFGLVAFFIALAAILQARQVLVGAAVGLIPMLMGVGFLIDARMNAREAAEEAVDSRPALPV